MKKMKYLLTILLAAVMLFSAAACTKTLPLDTPTNLVIDDASYTLYWRYVPAARSYNVEVTGVDGDYYEVIPSHYTHVSLADLAEGDYKVRVMAIGGAENEATSEWSEAKEFHRPHESGLVYTAINANTEYAVSGIGSASGDVVIDATYRGKPVTAIAADAFRGRGNSRISSVTVPEGIRTVGESAFYNCTNLTSVTLPDSVTSIGAKLFQGCSRLSSVRLPAGLTSIPEYTFAYCRALEEIEIGDAVTYIGESAFYSCSTLKHIEFPDSVAYIGPHAFDSAKAMTAVSFGSGLRQIDQYAFYNCVALGDVTFAELKNAPAEGEGLSEETEEAAAPSLVLSASVFEGCEELTKIALPEGLTSIGGQAFYRCLSLENVTIPDSVTEVEAYAFYETALYDKQIQEEQTFIYADRWLLKWEIYGWENYPTEEERTNARMEELGKFTELTPDMVAEGTVGIADQAFLTSLRDSQGRYMGAPKLSDVELKASIRYLGKYAFYNCQSLSGVRTQMGSALVSIGEYAFYSCTTLRNVVFPEGLLEIDSYAFRECMMLTGGDHLVPGTVERIGTYAFIDSGLWTNAANADGIAYAGNWVVGFNDSTSASKTNLVFKDGVIGVADFAFYQNESVTSIEKLKNAEHIGRGAFYQCTSLTSISLNDNLTEIADNTFAGCSSLFLANLPFSLKRIGRRAFHECKQLDAIDLSATDVEEIGDYAFYGCLNVKSLLLGQKLQTIGDYAFYGLEQIPAIVFPDSVKEIGANCFAGCAALGSITFGKDLERVGAGSFQRCAALGHVEIPDTVRSVGGYAFYKCENLASVTLGNGVEEIGSYAFGATALTSVVIPASVKKIAEYAFKSTYQLDSVLMLGLPDEVGIHAFYGSPDLTFYIAASAEDAQGKFWSGRWNSAYRPVVWNVAVSEDGYVASITADVANVENAYARYGVHGPGRAGYDFVGWATSPGGEVVYGADEWRNADTGTTLYPVWTEHVDVPADPEGPEQPDPETTPDLPSQTDPDLQTGAPDA